MRDNNLEGSLLFQLLKVCIGDLLGSLDKTKGINLSSSAPNIISGGDNGLSTLYIISPAHPSTDQLNYKTKNIREVIA